MKLTTDCSLNYSINFLKKKRILWIESASAHNPTLWLQNYLWQNWVTVSRTQRIGAKESAEAKPERRYEKLSYICTLNRHTDIVFQSVKAIE